MLHNNQVDENDEKATDDRGGIDPLEIENDDEETDQERVGLVSSSSGIGQTMKPIILNVNVMRNHSMRRCIAILLAVSIIVLAFVVLVNLNSSFSSSDETKIYYPTELFQKVYKNRDFENEHHVIPPYWEDVIKRKKRSFREDDSTVIPHLGPCYLPKEKIDWQKLMEKNRYVHSEGSIKYMNTRQSLRNSSPDGLGQENLAGLCRPGFIIIGAGKCGTSSLYHYLVGHPRVLPAKNKQIHYFKYWTFRPIYWYLSNFPPAKTFLSNGALMTGEASPGYLVSMNSFSKSRFSFYSTQETKASSPY